MTSARTLNVRGPGGSSRPAASRPGSAGDRAADDGPLASLDIALAGTGLRDPHDERWSPTDATGRFVVHPEDDSYLLAVLHPSGFATQAGAGHDRVIRLEPWATLTFLSTGDAADQKADVTVRPAGAQARGARGPGLLNPDEGPAGRGQGARGRDRRIRSLAMGQGTAISLPVERFSLNPGEVRSFELEAPGQAERRVRGRFSTNCIPAGATKGSFSRNASPLGPWSSSITRTRPAGQPGERT